MLIYVYNLLKIDPLLFFFLKRWKMIRVQMEQGTKKTFHLDCVALIVEVDRWSDRRRRETGGRHISRTVGERRREEARCGNGPTYSPLRLKIFARVVHLKRDWPVHSPLRDRHHSSSFCSSSPLDHFACHSTAPAAAAAAPPRGAGCYQRLAHKTSRSSILSTTIFDYI